MTIMKALFALLCLLASAHAPAQSTPSFFFGGSLGQSDIDESIVAERGLISSGSIEGKDNGFKIFGGGYFSPRFGAELAYVDLGEATYSGDFFGSAVTAGKVGIWGYNLAALVRFPLGERFSLFGKLGVFLWESEQSDLTDGAPTSSTTRGWDGGSFGIGVAWRFTDNLSARVEFEQFPVDTSDASLLSLGLQYRF